MMARAIRALFVIVLVITGAAPHGRNAFETAAPGVGQTASLASALGVTACVDGSTRDCGSSTDHERVPSDCSLATCFLILPRLSASTDTIDSSVRLMPRLRDAVADGRIRERLERPPRTA